MTESLNMKEIVKEELEQGYKQAEKMSKLMRERNQREVKPIGYFLDGIHQAQLELEEGVRFLEKAEVDPQLIFTDAQNVLKSTKGMVYTVMKNWKSEDLSTQSHDFQAYLAYLANQYFQEWLQSQNIKESFQIEVRKSNQFPSIFAIYHETMELIQFNLFEKWYGIRQKVETEEEVTEKHNKRLRELDEEIQKKEKSLQEAISRRDHPLKHYKGVKNYLSWVFINKKKLHQAFENLVQREEMSLNHFKKLREREVQTMPRLLEEANERRKYVGMIEPFFQHVAYSFNDKKHQLY